MGVGTGMGMGVERGPRMVENKVQGNRYEAGM